MVEEVFVPVETALLLRKRGFDEATFWIYDRSTGEKHPDPRGTEVKNSMLKEPNISCPTLQMALMWLRERKGIYIIPRVVKNDKYNSPEDVHFIVEVLIAGSGNWLDNDWFELDYESIAFNALNYVLAYCLMEPGETAASLLNDNGF